MTPMLLLSSRHTPDSQVLWRAAVKQGWKVERLTGWNVPPEIVQDDSPKVLHVEGLFAFQVAKTLNVPIQEPPDDWLVNLPYRFRKRNIFLTHYGAARALDGKFVKPPNDKSFQAKIYRQFELSEEYDFGAPVLVAEPIKWQVEFRAFVLNKKILTMSPYLRGGVIDENRFQAEDQEVYGARYFLSELLQNVEVPEAIVIDVGLVEHRGWAAVELNAPWGSGLYQCDPHEALKVISRSCGVTQDSFGRSPSSSP